MQLRGASWQKSPAHCNSTLHQLYVAFELLCLLLIKCPACRAAYMQHVFHAWPAANQLSNGSAVSTLGACPYLHVIVWLDSSVHVYACKYACMHYIYITNGQQASEYSMVWRIWYHSFIPCMYGLN